MIFTIKGLNDHKLFSSIGKLHILSEKSICVALISPDFPGLPAYKGYIQCYSKKKC